MLSPQESESQRDSVGSTSLDERAEAARTLHAELELGEANLSKQNSPASSPVNSPAVKPRKQRTRQSSPPEQHTETEAEGEPPPRRQQVESEAEMQKVGAKDLHTALKGEEESLGAETVQEARQVPQLESCRQNCSSQIPQAALHGAEISQRQGAQHEQHDQQQQLESSAQVQPAETRKQVGEQHEQHDQQQQLESSAQVLQAALRGAETRIWVGEQHEQHESSARAHVSPTKRTRSDNRKIPRSRAELQKDQREAGLFVAEVDEQTSAVSETVDTEPSLATGCEHFREGKTSVQDLRVLRLGMHVLARLLAHPVRGVLQGHLKHWRKTFLLDVRRAQVQTRGANYMETWAAGVYGNRVALLEAELAEQQAAADQAISRLVQLEVGVDKNWKDNVGVGMKRLKASIRSGMTQFGRLLAQWRSGWIRSLQEQIEVMEVQVAQTMEVMENSLAIANNSPAQLEQYVAKLEADNAALEASKQLLLAEMGHRFAGLEAKNRKLAEQANGGQKLIEMSAALEQVRAENEKLSAEAKSMLESSSRRLAQSHEQLAGSEKVTERLQAENEAFRLQIKEMEDAAQISQGGTAQVESARLLLERDCETLQARVAELEASVLTTGSQHEAQAKEIADRKNVEDDIRRELLDLHEKYSTLEQEHATLNEALLKTELELADEQKTTEAMQLDANQWRDAKDASEKKIELVRKELQDMKVDLEFQETRAKSAEQKKALLSRELARLQASQMSDALQAAAEEKAGEQEREASKKVEEEKQKPVVTAKTPPAPPPSKLNIERRGKDVKPKPKPVASLLKKPSSNPVTTLSLRKPMATRKPKPEPAKVEPPPERKRRPPVPTQPGRIPKPVSRPKSPPKPRRNPRSPQLGGDMVF